jgi:hypothetical protein
MRCNRSGMLRSTSTQRPPRCTRQAARAHGIPFAVRGSARSISWKCRCGAVELPVWPTRPTWHWVAGSRSVGHWSHREPTPHGEPSV